MQQSEFMKRVKAFRGESELHITPPLMRNCLNQHHNFKVVDRDGLGLECVDCGILTPMQGRASHMLALKVVEQDERIKSQEGRILRLEAALANFLPED